MVVAPDSEVLGHFDGIHDGRALGWAFAPSAPDRRVPLQLVIDGTVVADTFADAYRVDLLQHGLGDGYCGYVIPLPEGELDGREHVVEVLDPRTGIPLQTKQRVFRLLPRGTKARRVTDLLFDAAMYERAAGPIGDALDHYRKVGWRRGLNPHPLFDLARYARLQDLGPDVEPLSHFEAVGQFAGASINALFDDAAVDEPVDEREHPVFRYLERRFPPGREPSRFFSDSDYAARDPVVVEAGFLPLVHYLLYGWREGRRPHADFDPKLFARLAELGRDVEPYGAFVDWLQERPAAVRVAAPRVSIIVLNVDKALLTLQCLFFVERHSPANEVEVIIVDNGSGDEDFALLCRYARGVDIVRLGVNRGFGEGNNIGVERARGEHVVFLNNDAFVTKNWLQPLLDVVDADPSVGAVGAKLLFPDGRLQEAGATISTCGTAVQRGKFLDPRTPIFNRTEPVDYCSAALLLVRAAAFRAVLGYDLCWDPAYYEDADLCLKLRAIGLKTVYAHRCEVVHIEHATSSVAQVHPTLRNIVATNRLKFVRRWTEDPLTKFRTDLVLESSRPATKSRTGSLALYSPYPLTPGGGERYLLTIAATFGRDRRCVLLTPDRYSRNRLLTLARELDLALDHVELGIMADAGRYERFDTFVCMGNEVLPPVGGIGARNIFHCQFPFPMATSQHGQRWRSLDGYDAVVVNSDFTADHYRRASKHLGLPAKPVLVVPPPVPQMPSEFSRPRGAPPRRILNVGRFARGGHCKRQDTMIEAFRTLVERIDTPVELHLAGAVGADLDARDYLDVLLEAGRDLPVVIHPNPSFDHIARLYAEAALYWHLTGIGRDLATSPHLFEHFGISIVEAMGAAVVPVALRGAGPSEIISDQVDGVLVDGASDLIAASAALLADGALRERLGSAATRRAADFTPELFGERFAEAVEKADGRPRLVRSAVS